MIEPLVIAAILAACSVILWLRPQSLTTLSETPQKNPELNWRAVRRISAGGTALLAAAIAGGSRLLVEAGATETTVTVVGIVVLFVGAIGIVAAVEIRKTPRK